MRHKVPSWQVVASAIVLALIGRTAGLLAQSDVATTDGVSRQPLADGVRFGATYAEWSARWWQWAFSFPAATNPINDTTGAACKEGQIGRVWFLAGTFGKDAVTRTCVIPAGTAIFIPVLNNVGFAPFPTEGVSHLRAQVAVPIDRATLVKATLDGVDLPGVRDLRVQSPAFSFAAVTAGILPAGYCPELFVPGNTPPSDRDLRGTLCNPAVSDGFWVLLAPLRPGEHTLRVRAKVPGDDPVNIDVTYNLTIER